MRARVQARCRGISTALCPATREALCWWNYAMYVTYMTPYRPQDTPHIYSHADVHNAFRCSSLCGNKMLCSFPTSFLGGVWVCGAGGNHGSVIAGPTLADRRVLSWALKSWRKRSIMSLPDWPLSVGPGPELLATIHGPRWLCLGESLWTDTGIRNAQYHISNARVRINS